MQLKRQVKDNETGVTIHEFYEIVAMLIMMSSTAMFYDRV